MDYIEFTGTPGDSPCVANDNLGPKGGCAEKILAIHATFCEQAIKPHSVNATLTLQFESSFG